MRLRSAADLTPHGAGRRPCPCWSADAAFPSVSVRGNRRFHRSRTAGAVSLAGTWRARPAQGTSQPAASPLFLCRSCFPGRPTSGAGTSQVHVRYISRAAARIRSPSGRRTAANPTARPGPPPARAPARWPRHRQQTLAAAFPAHCGRRPPPGPRRATARPWPSVKADGHTDRARDRRPSAICPWTPRHNDPTALQDDTGRDQEETARTAAYPQLTGRFRRGWQVVDSNHRRRSRRFYRPLPLAARATCQGPPVSGGTDENSGRWR